MRRRPRLLRIAKWTAVVVCVTIFSSVWWSLAWEGHSYGGRLARCAVELGYGDCGDDLTGNVSGMYPECGRAAPDAAP